MVSLESACNAGNSGLILGWKDPMVKGMANHSTTLAWRIPRPMEPGSYNRVIVQVFGEGFKGWNEEKKNPELVDSRHFWACF